jgi:hypothetical protein
MFLDFPQIELSPTFRLDGGTVPPWKKTLAHSKTPYFLMISAVQTVQKTNCPF